MAKPPLEWAWLDGGFVEAAGAKVSAFDRGFLFADSVYEVIPVYDGALFRVDDHLARLDCSLAGIRAANPFDTAGWKGLLEELVARNGGGRQAVYLQVSRGAETGRDHRLPDGIEPTVFAFSTAGVGKAPGAADPALRAVSLEDTRWARCDLKTTALLANVLLRAEAVDRGADEVLLHRAGRLTEGAVSNVFVVREGRVATPPLGNDLLAGITRAVVLELLETLGIPHEERDITTSECGAAEEIWVTSTTREIAPVVELDGAPVGDGAPGPVFHRVRAAFDALVAGGT